MNNGYCQCGCGELAPLAKKTDKRHGHVKGQPVRFIGNHNRRLLTGDKNPNWKGGRMIDYDGYVLILNPDHPRANIYGYIGEHVLVAENILGNFLPQGAIPHHHDGNRSNNVPSNLVICQDFSYHMLLHKREKAFRECGHASWRRCGHCGEYDDRKNLYDGKHHHMRNGKCLKP